LSPDGGVLAGGAETHDAKVLFHRKLAAGNGVGSYEGVCSSYLGRCSVGDDLRLWMCPGSFHKLPLEVSNKNKLLFKRPILCVGAGTGVAPLRALLREREAMRRITAATSSAPPTFSLMRQRMLQQVP